MKRLFNVALILMLAVLFATAAIWDYDVVKWNSGSVSSTGLITTNSDTTDAFDLTYSERTSRGRQDQFPEEISIMLWATEGTNSDSTNVTWTLDLSNDQTYWYNYGTIATQTSATSDTAATSVTNYTLGLAHNNQIASIAESITNASYDTTVFNSDTTGYGSKGFFFLDSTFSHKAETYTATETYTYSSQTDWPKFRYGRLRATLAVASGDTLSIGAQVSKLYK